MTLVDLLLGWVFGLFGLGSFVLAGWLIDRRLGPHARAWGRALLAEWAGGAPRDRELPEAGGRAARRPDRGAAGPVAIPRQRDRADAEVAGMGRG